MNSVGAIKHGSPDAGASTADAAHDQAKLLDTYEDGTLNGSDTSLGCSGKPPLGVDESPMSFDDFKSEIRKRIW